MAYDEGTRSAPRAPRMTLASVVTTAQRAPMRELVYGVEGIGKTQFAASAPNPIFLGGEEGARRLAVGKFPVVQSWGDVHEALDVLERSKHGFQTLVIDTLDSLEPHVWREVCAQRSVDGIESFGYGKGYVFALEVWQQLTFRLEALQRDRGMHVLLIAHSQIRKHASPDAEDYDRYTLKLNEKAASHLREWCESVMFASYDVQVRKASKTARARGELRGRWLYTQRTAAFDAKNRYGLPSRLPLDFGEFWSRYEATVPEDAGELREEALRGIDKLAKLGDPATAALARDTLAKVGSDVVGLRKILARLATRIETREEALAEEGASSQSLGLASARDAFAQAIALAELSIKATAPAKAGDPVTLQARVDGPAPTPNTKATAAPASPPAPTPTNPKASAVGAAVATSKAPGVAAPLATTMRDVRCVPFSPPVREILESWGYASDGWSEIKGLLDGEDFVEIHKAAAERLETDEGLGLVWAAVGTPARTYPTIRQAEQFVGLVEARAKAALAPRVVPAPGLAARMGVPAGHDLAPDESVDTETGEVVSSDRPLDATPTPAVGTPIPSSVEGMRSTQLAPARSCLADEVTAKDPSKAEARPVKSWAPVATVEDVLARIGRSQGSHAEAVIAAPEGELVSQALQGACTNLLHAAVEAEHGPANASAKSTMTKALKACRLSLAERWTGGALRLLIGRFAVRFPDALGKGVQSWA